MPVENSPEYWMTPDFTGSKESNWRIPNEAYLTLFKSNYKNEKVSEEMFNELNERVKDIDTVMKHDPLQLYRFLHARGNVEDALKQFQAAVEKRAEMGADDLCDADIPASVNRGHYAADGACGESVEGMPVLYLHSALEDYFGRIDCIADKGGFQCQLKGMCLWFDAVDNYLRAKSIKAGRIISQCVIIQDLTGASVSCLTPFNVTTYKNRLAFSEIIFPERAKCLFIIYPPSIFATAFELFKPVLSEGTLRKIQVAADATALKGLIDDDNLPEYLGGKRRVFGDPYCRYALKGTTIFIKAPTNAEKAASADHEFMLSSVQLKTNVSAQGTYKDFRCVLAGTKIKWSLQLPSKDIDFKIKKFINGGPLEGEVIHEISRAAYGKIHEGEIDAIDEEATYEFVYDNSYSWATSKDIVFSYDKC